MIQSSKWFYNLYDGIESTTHICDEIITERWNYCLVFGLWLTLYLRCGLEDLRSLKVLLELLIAPWSQ